MEAGTIFYSAIPWNPRRSLPRNPSSFPRFTRAFANPQSQRGYRGPKPSKDWIADWVMNNDDAVRSLPIYVGGASLLAVLFNRTVSGIAPVADASRAWESLSVVTCCRSLVIVYNGICVLQIGMAAESGNNGEAVTVDTSKLMQGSVYVGVMRSGAQSYLANLLLYPGRSELPFLPSNTQSWIAFIGEKLEATLSKYSNIVPSMVQDGI